MKEEYKFRRDDILLGNGKAEFDNGNGAIMRIAPLAFILLYTEFDFIKEVKMIKRYTEITHAHPRVIVGSIHAPFLE